MLGKQLKEYRRREGMSQQQLADELGVSRQSVVRWEKESNTPSDHELKKISDLLGLSAQQLLNEDETTVSEETTVSGVEEAINDISYGVTEQKKILEEISSKQATSKDIESLKESIYVSKEHLEIQKQILHQKKIRNRILIIFAVVIVLLVALLLYGIAFYANENSYYAVYRPITYNEE